MKLRLRTNSIRFRLLRSEVDSLRTGKACHEVVSFPGDSHLKYSLVPSLTSTIQVSFADSALDVEVPRLELANWCESNEVGLSAQIPLPGGGKLDVLIEKDFRCLDNRDHEDQADTFDNPLISHPACE